MDTGINRAFYQKHARKLSATHFELDAPAGKDERRGEASGNLQRTDLKFYVPDEPGVYILQIVPDVATARTADSVSCLNPFQGIDTVSAG